MPDFISGQMVEQLEKDIASAKNCLKMDKEVLSIEEIVVLYKEGKITVAPDFQILFRWSNFQQTRFIESILLGFPIPPIFVAENEKKKWVLVDGLQRLSTVVSFFGVLQGKEMEAKNNWTMCKGELVKSLDGFTFHSLPAKLQQRIKHALCRIEIIKWNNNPDMQYILLNRLNSGGAMVTDQEIKNCIFRTLL
jgi:Uncharacterized conserved protein